jgi:hypothetical protein
VSPHSLILLLALVILAVCSVLNWTAFTTSTKLSLMVANVEALLGLLMLVVTGPHPRPARLS